MNCIYCNRVLISSADDYSNSICCDCKNINLEQNPLLTKIHNLEQENKQLKEQLAIREKAFELCRKEFDKLYLQTTDMIFDSENYFIEQAKENMK